MFARRIAVSYSYSGDNLQSWSTTDSSDFASCVEDTSSESEYESDQESTPGSDSEDENLEPELSQPTYEEYNNAIWNPQAQLQARRLVQLYAEIKARAQLPDPAYQKLSRSWPARPFDIRILPDYVQYPVYYFELFWDSEIWNTLVENTN